MDARVKILVFNDHRERLSNRPIQRAKKAQTEGELTTNETL
jgi:hypothetical protein